MMQCSIIIAIASLRYSIPHIFFVGMLCIGLLAKMELNVIDSSLIFAKAVLLPVADMYDRRTAKVVRFKSATDAGRLEWSLCSCLNVFLVIIIKSIFL